MMPIDHIPDWEQRLARQDAFWEREILDRPVVTISLPKPNPAYPWPANRTYPTIRDRWMDTERVAACALAGVVNTDYLGDALPTAWPNLGPEVFSAFFGCELEFGETTSWSIPNLTDWSDVGKIRVSDDGFYWRKMLELTDAFLEIGKGKFYTGLTDMHPGGDAVTAFRDPVRLNFDMLEATAEVKALLEIMNQAYFSVYDFYFDKLKAAGQAISTWAGIVSTKKWYVPSNDFSCMISKEMFDEVFLPGIIEECQFLEASIYHLDGPGALQHLESLLEIKELKAVQWVYGAGHGRASDWMHVYKRCQGAGKGIQVGLAIEELDYFMENLKPEGVWISLSGVQDREHAEALIRK
ncbi:MAG: trimethylamine corrinoid protein 2, partial [Armatimonadetes bacterium]|nr:trimethylamine corrinoid protein 2 [Armatimonadota bacterium]